MGDLRSVKTCSGSESICPFAALRVLAAAALFCAATFSVAEIDSSPEPSPVGQAVSTEPRDAPVPGVARPDSDSIAVTLAAAHWDSRDSGHTGSDLLLHHFFFNGSPVASSKFHFKQLSPGVLEITSLAYSLGEWRFSVRDSASYYGLGERFNTLNHAHAVVRNLSMDNGGPKGGTTYKPMPFFMSTSGYGIWVDTTAEATFDMNATSLPDVLITVPAQKLRVVVFTPTLLVLRPLDGS